MGKGVPEPSLLDIPSPRKSKFLLDDQPTMKVRASIVKPNISKPVNEAQDLKSRLSRFLPDLKAANEALPENAEELDIEKVDEDGQYIEMDLGLGVLEEIKNDSDSSDSGDIDKDNALAKLLKRSDGTQPGMIQELDDPNALQTSELCCDAVFQKYKKCCIPAFRHDMDIVLSLMTRILIQLHRFKSTTDVNNITRLNVLREDMYKLMSRRDRLIDHAENVPKHESLYFEELDELLSST